MSGSTNGVTPPSPMQRQRNGLRGAAGVEGEMTDMSLQKTSSFGFIPCARKYAKVSQNDENEESIPLEKSVWRDLRGDYMNQLLLQQLYTLQGIPMGISMTIPLVMLERHAGYAAQAVFSIVTLPFSFKLLWAPLVDTYYSKVIGRRKSWTIPTQLLCGLCLWFYSSAVDSWIGTAVTTTAENADLVHHNVGLNVSALSSFFVVLYLLMATQDIAVDAWALTILRRRNVGWASTVNNVGQYLGIYLAHVGYLVFSSADTCNKYFRSVPQEHGMLDLELFMKGCGFLFLVCTVLVGLFKKESSYHPIDVTADAVVKLSSEGIEDIEEYVENPSIKMLSTHGETALATIQKHKWCLPIVLSETRGNEEIEEEQTESQKETFRRIWLVLKQESVQWLVVFLLTHRIGTAPGDNLTQLKLFDRGLTKADIAMVVSLISPITIVVPMLTSSLATGPTAFRASFLAIPVRIMSGFIWAAIVAYFPQYKNEPWFYTLLVIMMGVQTAMSVFQSVLGMSFFSRIADPRIGGTFMTLLNTAANLGGSMTRLAVVYIVDYFTTYHCVSPQYDQTPMLGDTSLLNLWQTVSLSVAKMVENTNSLGLYACEASETVTKQCLAAGGECKPLIDGYFVEIGLFSVIGLLWITFLWKKLCNFDALPPSAWRVSLTKA